MHTLTWRSAQSWAESWSPFCNGIETAQVFFLPSHNTQQWTKNIPDVTQVQVDLWGESRANWSLQCGMQQEEASVKWGNQPTPNLNGIILHVSDSLKSHSNAELLFIGGNPHNNKYHTQCTMMMLVANLHSTVRPNKDCVPVKWNYTCNCANTVIKWIPYCTFQSLCEGDCPLGWLSMAHTCYHVSKHWHFSLSCKGALGLPTIVPKDF